MIVLADNKFVKITLNKELFLVSVTWKAYAISLEDYQYAFSVALDFQESQEFPIYNFVSDLREQNVVPPHFRLWFQEIAIPRAVRQGLRRAAVVTDAGVFKRYYLNHVMNTTKKFGLPLKLFKAPESAYNWFKSCLEEDLANPEIVVLKS